MNEKLLQFIWQHRYFRNANLFTTSGESLLILFQGTLNHYQGPDFLEGIIQINQTKWVGNIELHINAGDWHKHQHQHDLRYQNIILHVVWEDDIPLKDGYGNLVPTLVLQDKVASSLLSKYNELMQSPLQLPCNNLLHTVNELIWSSWKERLAIERLLKRSNELIEHLKKTTGNWNLLIWQLVAKAIGGKVNGPLFSIIIQSVPFTVWLHCQQEVLQLEAVLMGQAGLLNENFKDDYPLQLQKEYKHLRLKYQLTPVKQTVAYLRMRPAGFPTIRFSQLAALMYRHKSLLESVLNMNHLPSSFNLFTSTASPYWDNHYRFNEISLYQPKIIGKQLQQSLVINAVVPVLFAYGESVKMDKWKEKAVKLLYNMPPEQNNVLTNWQQIQVINQCALHSQALIELAQFYCAKKACLSCAIGNAIIKK